MALGRLRNGGVARELAAVPRCGARTRAGGACAQPAMAGGRCRLHGGRATGPRTEAGRAAQVGAVTAQGGRSVGYAAARRETADMLRLARAMRGLLARRGVRDDDG